jgi:DNA-binding GntR family transcriptional regulator
MSTPHAGGPGSGRISTTYPDRDQREARRPGAPADRAVQIAGPAVSVLADRLAAALVHHEPGWRLPRHSALARRYNVSAAEIYAAVEELVSRHLVRRLADGQVYRASPAEYVIGLEGVPGLMSYVDAMGGEFSCRSRQVTWRLPPEDISWALRLSADQQVCTVRYLWTAGGEPAALCTTYVPADMASRPDAGGPAGLPTVLNLLQLTGVADSPAARPTNDAGHQLTGSATALHIELQAPPPSIARSLRLTAGQPAVIVTVRFEDLASGRPMALTIAVLRPDMFRVVVQTPLPPLPDRSAGSLSGSWTHAVEDWEP